jgi:hypothetical protein
MMPVARMLPLPSARLNTALAIGVSVGSVVDVLIMYTDAVLGGGGVTTEAGSATVTVMVPPLAGVVNEVTLSVGTV